VVIAAKNIGEMAEWSNAAVSKTVVRLPANRGFESPSLREAKLLPQRSWGIFVLQIAESGLPE
jgi:hypothetical protein